MKIIQIIGNLTYGDGVSNCLLSLSEILDELNYPNIIMVLNRIDERVKKENIVKGDICEPILADKDDILIYHFAIGGTANYIVERLPYKKILVYQNVTTPDFYRGIDDTTLNVCLWGEYDASKTVGKYLKSIVMSEFSKNNLMKMGWKEQDISVMPIIKISDRQAERNQELAAQFSDGFVNILFTGRIAPNKKIEDIIRIFSCYQKTVCSKSRLILVGGIGYKNYYKALLEYIHSIKVDNVILTGHVSNEDLETYYSVADVFLCMSEHEGFCIPLVEAMKREIPVIAYSATAVPDTLGEAGILVNTKDGEEIAHLIDKLVTDKQYREGIVKLQNKRVNSLDLENYKCELKKILEEVHHMEKYSYTIEPKEISVEYPVRRSMNCIDDLQKLYRDEEKIVIYGIGKVGKTLLAECEKFWCMCMEKTILCDNSFPRDSFKKLPVMKHKECVKAYPEAVYIVTIQNACVEIIADLTRDGIKKRNIRFFNASSQKLI